MAEQVLFAGTGANFNDGGTVAWTSPTNIQGDTTGTSASCAPGGDGLTSQRLRASNFGFTIPTDATIDNILVELERSAGNNNRFRGTSSRLLIDGTETGGDKGGTTWFGKTFESFDGSPASWGFASGITPAQVNATGFGFSVKGEQFVSQNVTAFAYRVRITITYTPAETPPNEGTGTVAGAGAISGIGESPAIAPNEGTGSVSASGAISGVGSTEHSGTSTVSALGAIEGVGSAEHGGEGTVSGSGAIAGIGEAPGTPPNEGVGSVAGSGAIAGIGEAPTIPPNEGLGTVSALGTIEGVGSAEHSGSGAVSGNGAIVGIGEAPGAAPNEGVGSVSGAGAIAGIGEAPTIPPNEGVGTVSALGELVGVGATEHSGAGTVSGRGAIQGVSDDEGPTCMCPARPGQKNLEGDPRAMFMAVPMPDKTPLKITRRGRR